MSEEDRYQHYEVLKRADGSLWELGHGAMGVTYKAYDTNLRCTVALKVINSIYLENETARQRFLREARAAAALRHQNVASVFHLGTDHGTYFYAMEFIDGQTVDEFLKQRGRLTPLEALDIAFQVARALGAAARQQLVHRDLKPANLMLVDEDGEKVVKVIDFGLAKSVERDAEGSAALTVGGGFVGTPHFASPEQLEDRDLDVRSDIYALGATLYYLVTGRPPFSGSVAQIMSQHLYKPVPREPLQGLPVPFVNLILSMMEKDRDKRPQSATELRRAIQHCVQELDFTELGAPASGIIRALRPDAMATAVSSPLSETAVEAGSVFSRKYRVDQPLPDHVAGKRYRGLDLERQLAVSLLVLSREFLADAPHFSALEAAVDQARNAPHPGLRQLIALETAGGQTVLVEEFLSTPSLQEILRVRGRLSALEVVAALEQLAPVADHARLKGLEYVDFTLSGIQVVAPGQGQDAAGLEQWIQRPLTEWPALRMRVAPIDFLFQANHSLHWAGEATVVQPSESLSGPKGSYVRRLSLLAYELLGGPRNALETHGRYTPIAALPEAGNQVLRRGLVDEVGTAGDLARALSGSLTGRFVLDFGRPVSIPAGHDPVNAGGQGPTASQPIGELTGAAATQLTIPGDPALPMPGRLETGVLLAQHYRLVEALGDTPQGRRFLADDLRQKRRVNLLVLSLEFASDAERWAALQEAVKRVGVAPHPLLRAIYSLEMAAGYRILVQEHVAGPALQEVLRARKVLGAPEVVRLLTLLAPLADHAIGQRLQHVDLTLQGIHLLSREDSMGSRIQADLLQLPLTASEPLELKVDAIDFLFSLPQTGTGSDPATQVHGAGESGSHGSCVRLLSLLAYELLGGLRPRLEATGQYTPLAALTEGANAALRRGVIDECPSAGELARQLAVAIGVAGPAAPGPELAGHTIPEPLPQIVPPAPGVKRSSTRKPGTGALRLGLALGFMVCIGIAGYILYRPQAPPLPPEFGNLAVESDPPGAVITLDEGPGSEAPHSFSRVPFGPHRLTATLKGYLPASQEVQLDNATPPKIVLTLRPVPTELAALSVQTEPPGASVLLDGKPPQQPPGTFTHVPFGHHQLTATLDGYEPLTQDLQVRPGMSPDLRLALRPVPIELAALVVKTEPAGASILLDGVAPQQPPDTFTHVPFGSHRLTATLDRYEPLTQELQVREGMNPKLRLTLRPVPNELAALAVKTDPAGASVLLDGKPPQQPPNNFTRVPFGRHQLTATLKGYLPVQQELQFNAATPSQIVLTLQPDPIEALRDEVKEYERGSPAYLSAYVRLVKALTSPGKPNPQEYNELTQVIEELRTKVPPISRDEFSLSYQASVREAANLDILPAILWLADNEKGPEAFDLFLRAATLGDSYAMMRVGRFYFRKGTPNDDKEGFEWLNRAYTAPKPNLEAGAYLGDCYLSGRGTKRDLQKAEKIIFPLANQAVVPAMVLAGRILQYKAEDKQADAGRNSGSLKQELTAQADALYGQAKPWWERAVERGDWNAAAHLGQLYEKGFGGVERNEEKAEELYKEGIKHSNVLCMYFYGLLISEKPGRRSEAVGWIKQAAIAGIPSAREWLRTHEVNVSDVTSEGEHY